MVKNLRKKTTEEKYPRLTINNFPLLKSNFLKQNSPKDELIKQWLKNYIEEGLKNGTIKENTLLPLKAKLAYYFGVGEGTVQNAVRKLEDEGLVASKQRIGTLIVGKNSNIIEVSNKLTSKRDKVVEQIKILIKDNYPVGTTLPNMKELEEILNSKRNTVRAALDFLTYQGLVAPITGARDENKLWKVLLEIPDTFCADFNTDIQAETLSQKIATKIEEYISKNCKVGSRLEPINILANQYNTSEKTVYDAIQILCQKGIIISRRGKYGTIVIKMPSDRFQPAKECSIFMNAADAAIYSYKRIENLLKNKIINEYNVGEKLPSMKELSQQLDVSTNTIRKAITDLAKEGYIAVSRGKFGGIYVLDIPEDSSQSFRWLAVNPRYVESYR